MVRACGAGKRPTATPRPAERLASFMNRNWKVVPMLKTNSSLRAMCAALLLLFAFALPAAAQLSFKPTAEAVREDQLLNALKEGDKITGRISIPDQMASSLIQPAGRDWRDFQRHKLPIIGGGGVLGTLGLLAVFFSVGGPLPGGHGVFG